VGSGKTGIEHNTTEVVIREPGKILMFSCRILGVSTIHSGLGRTFAAMKQKSPICVAAV
jgi:hypothetical protein